MKLYGKISFPGDKSISHRALMLASLSKGQSIIENISNGKDVNSTKECLSSCGIPISCQNNRVVVTGTTFKPPNHPLDCGNSGTTARLLTGLLTGQKINSIITGDSSLSSRPMSRVINPLEMMGAEIYSQNGYLPLSLHTKTTTGITYSPPIASAQVKSAILFAGLGSEGSTTVTERNKTRDHTELMLQFLGAPMTIKGNTTIVNKLSTPLDSFHLSIPGDPSTAAFFAGAAAVISGSDLLLNDLLVNPTRTGFFTVLNKMGAGIEMFNHRQVCGELICDIRVSPKRLKGITISKQDIPGIIDEIPILAVLATQAEGTTQVYDAKELRVKESDRITAICENLSQMGGDITEMEDGFIIRGPTTLQNRQIQTYNDHRIAMAFSIASLIAGSSPNLDNSECIDVSCPEFNDLLKQVIQ